MRTARTARTCVAVLLTCALGAAAAGDFLRFGDCKVSRRPAGELFCGDRLLLSRFGWVAVAPNVKGAAVQNSLTVFPVATLSLEADGSGKATAVNTVEQLGFTCETHVRLSPNRMLYTITYRFARELKDHHIYLNPALADEFALGAGYRAVDVDGLASEGVVKPWPGVYRQIPRKDIGLRELVLIKDGLSFTLSLACERPSTEAHNLRLDFVRENGEFAGRTPDRHARLWLTLKTPDNIFPAGYENRLTLKVEVDPKTRAPGAGGKEQSAD